MHACMHAQTYAYAHEYLDTRARMYACMCALIYVRACVCGCVNISYICMYTTVSTHF